MDIYCFYLFPVSCRTFVTLDAENRVCDSFNACRYEHRLKFGIPSLRLGITLPVYLPATNLYAKGTK